MSEQRLKPLMRKTEPEYVHGSPVVLSASALYVDNVTSNCVAQLKWKNIDRRTVKAVMIELYGLDAFGQKLDPIEQQYYDVHAEQGKEFGNSTPIIIRTNKIVKYKTCLKAVSFEDDTVWRPEAQLAFFEPLPAAKPQKIDGELYQQFVIDLNAAGYKQAAEHGFQQAMGLWQCGCGSWQYIDANCLNCGITQEALAKVSDTQLLLLHLSERKEQEEKRRLENERKRIAEEKRAEAAQIDKSFDEIFRAANYLLDRLDPAYNDAVDMHEEIYSSRFGKKSKAKNIIPVFQKIVSCMKEPMSAIVENLPMALQGQDTYPQEVYEAYLLLQKALDKRINQLTAFVQNEKNERIEEQKQSIRVLSNQYKEKIGIVRMRTDEMR